MPELDVSSQYEDLARASLLEITKPDNVGELIAQTTDDDGVITVRFASVQEGYPGWQWNVSLAHVEGYDPTVIEAELLPADGALLAPDWVPWSDRLADYKAAQEAAGLEADALVADDDDDDPDEDADLDDDDLDDEDDDLDDGDAIPVLHGGDLDGVDIDDLDDSAEDDIEVDVFGAEVIQDEVAESGADDSEDR
jgi:hypothetical protein